MRTRDQDNLRSPTEDGDCPETYITLTFDPPGRNWTGNKYIPQASGEVNIAGTRDAVQHVEQERHVSDDALEHWKKNNCEPMRAGRIESDPDGTTLFIPPESPIFSDSVFNDELSPDMLTVTVDDKADEYEYYRDKHQLADVESVTVYVSDVLKAIKFNRTNEGSENYEFKITDYEGDVEAKLHFDTGGFYPPDANSTPYHFPPEAYMIGHEDGHRNQDWMDVDGAARWPDRLEDRSIWRRDTNEGEDGMDWDDWREHTLKLWKEHLTPLLKSVEEITFSTRTSTGVITTTAALNVIDDRDDE